MKKYKRYRYPDQIIDHAIWLYHRFTLSFRDVEDLLAERGIIATYETIRQWCLKIAPKVAKKLRKKQGTLGDHWFIDEVFIKINGKQHYLWRAVDQDGCELDILVTKRRNKKAAKKFFKKLLKHHEANQINTDKLRSYPAALRELNSSIPHNTKQYCNNISEISHQKTRQKQRQMRGFKSMKHAQLLLTCHGIINNHFRHQRHLLNAKHYRELRERSLFQYQQNQSVHD